MIHDCRLDRTCDFSRYWRLQPGNVRVSCLQKNETEKYAFLPFKYEDTLQFVWTHIKAPIRVLYFKETKSKIYVSQSWGTHVFFT